MKTKYLVFDFDGVLGDTYDARMEVFIEMGKTKEEVIEHTEKYFTKSTHTRDLNLNQETISSIKDWTIRFGTSLNQKGFNLFNGFIEELKKVKNAKMAVVSSGSAIYIKPKLEKIGLEFSSIMTMEDHHSKEEKVEQICKDWNILVKDAYFFTDTVSDVKELSNIMDKNKIYGCAWGYQDFKKLSTVLDEKNILNRFNDIQKIKWT